MSVDPAAQGAVLGLDSGGTKTVAIRLLRDGSIAGTGTGPGANPFDQPDWRQTLAAVIAPLATLGLSAASFGLGGYGEIPDVSAEQEAFVHNQLQDALSPDLVSVSNDVEMAFDGAFPGGDGILILSGTGSMAWAGKTGQDGHRLSIRIGGWGHRIGDEGSAYWIGLEALRRVTQYLDGRRPESADLAVAILEGLDVRAPLAEAGPALLEWHRTLAHPRSAIAALARIVDRLAEAGSPVARELLEAAAWHLGRHIEAARQRLGDASLPWSCGGSAFSSANLRTALTRTIGTVPNEPALPPIGGTLLRAARLAGWPTHADWVRALGATLRRHGLAAR